MAAVVKQTAKKIYKLLKKINDLLQTVYDKFIAKSEEKAISLGGDCLLYFLFIRL